jgi:hypothetical protein
MLQSEWRRLMFEACIYLGLLLFLAQQKALRSTLKALRLPYRVFLVTFVMLLIGGELVDRGRKTFPFVGWPLYTSPAHGDPHYYDYTMVSESGREMPLEVFRLSGSLSYRLMFPLKSLTRNIAQAPEGPRRQAMIADYELVLQTLARIYNRRHAEDPIQTIRVWDCTIPLHQYRNPASIRRTLFRELQVQP